ncbi:MAG: hypothetical protein RMK94_09130 [Armatimonadota bacterium]|nr:hypothetical protein [Armatimonadota bacterium]
MSCLEFLENILATKFKPLCFFISWLNTMFGLLQGTERTKLPSKSLLIDERKLQSENQGEKKFQLTTYIDLAMALLG